MHHDDELNGLIARFAGPVGMRAASFSPAPVLAPAAPMAKPDQVERVTNGDELRRAIRAAKGGWRLVLADGLYDGPMWWEYKGGPATLDRPVEIVAENPGKAVIVKDAAMPKPCMMSFGLRFKGWLEFRENVEHLSALACWFNGPKSIYIRTAKHWNIGYCSFTGYGSKSARFDNIYLQVPDTGPNLPDNGRVFRSWFYDPFKDQTAENHFFYIGNTDEGYDKSPSFKNLVLYGNLMDGEKRRSIYVKRGCAVIGNHVVMGGRGGAGSRWGENGRWWGNRIVGAKDIEFNGRNHDLRCNYLRCSDGTALKAQHLSRTNNRYVAADGAVLVHNDGPVIVGDVVKGGKLQRPVRDVRVEAHIGRVTLVKKAQVNTTVIKASDVREVYEPEPAATLTYADVGPRAWPGPWPTNPARGLPDAALEVIEEERAFAMEAAA